MLFTRWRRGISTKGLILRSSRDPLIPQFPWVLSLQIIIFFSRYHYGSLGFYLIRYIESGTVKTNTSKTPKVHGKSNIRTRSIWSHGRENVLRVGLSWVDISMALGLASTLIVRGKIAKYQDSLDHQ